MLPSIPDSHREMPQSTGLNLYAPFLDHADSARYHPQPEDTPPQQPRAFPIRTSQSHRRVAASSVSPYPQRSEHHLRRKTPNGIIDAAYDGSPAQPNPDIPPLKHMILPATAITYQHHLTETFPRIHRREATINHDPLLDHDRHEASGNQWSSNNEDWRLHGLAPGAATSFHTFQYNHMGNPNLFPNVHQPVARANEYNVRAFCPPPIPTSEALFFGQSGWQPSPLALSRPYAGYTRNVDGAMGVAGSYLTSNRLAREGFPVPSIPCPTNYGYPYRGLRSTYADLDGLDLNNDRVHYPPLHDANYEDQPRFREKALSHAHKTYIELLAHLQTVRRSQKSGGGSQASMKPLVYPKPPNPLPLTATQPPRIPEFVVHSASNSTHGYLSKPDYTPLKALHGSAPVPAQSATITTPYMTQREAFAGTNQARVQQQYLQMTPYYADFSSKSLPPNKPQAVMNAKSSLEVLNSLCEQSGWKWINGMLLGGCLHYGLENYDEALQWFSRITALEPSHIEAITNVAATLFCLDRPDEAEQHWLKAVRLCPAYLEATEHLVGLLYRKRSKKAIEIINFVQQSLKIQHPNSQQQLSAASIDDLGLGRDVTSKISDTTFAAGALGRTRRGIASDSPETLGFGSSGYALPGCENARILSLIHAKGTMLYSLKEIDQASEAFEEAVLISVGRRIASIHELVRRIQVVLAPANLIMGSRRQVLQQPAQPLLLPPEKARQTASLAFGGNGELPGLLFVVDGIPKRAATQTTSNSLLSLAKIFQDAMSGGAAGPKLLQRSSGVGDILSLYYLSLSLQESPSTANNVGILLAGVQQGSPQTSNLSGNLRPSSSPQPNLPGVQPGSGLALALAYYQYGLRLDPKHVHLHTNLGSLLKDIGQLDLAIQMYEQAVSCDGSFDIALTNLANAVKDRGRINDAIMYYRRAVRSNPDFAEAVCGLFTALNSVCDWKGRGGVLLESGKFDRWHVDENGMLLDGLSHDHSAGLTKRVVGIVRRQLQEASRWGFNTLQDDVIRLFARQLACISEATVDDLESWLRAWKQKPWEGSRLLRLVERATRVTLWRWYRDRHVNQERSTTQYTRPRLPLSLTVPSAPTVLPFHTFTCPLGPKDIRAISQRNANRISCSTLRSPWLPPIVYPPPPPPSPCLNVGYVSSDFNNHPLAHLMQSVFGLHDRRRVRAVCYATTASDKSAYRRQIEQQAPVFRDASCWSSDKLVQQIVDDKIHILVNLNGYTRGARNEIFSARPAPIQMSFMGFAGTLGAEWCDYILADSTAIPASTLRPWRKNSRLEDVFQDDSEGDADNWVYSENIIFCRDTFFCCDHAQSCDDSERQISWEEEQRRRWRMRKELFPSLPDDTIILGNFNQLYKVLAANTISGAKGSALAFALPGTRRGKFAKYGKALGRLRGCKSSHVHGRGAKESAHRACKASILKGALPKTEEGRIVASELIAESEGAYEQSAIRLAGSLTYTVGVGGYGEGSGRLAEMRSLLWQSKWQCGLFDTRRWVDEVENAYEEAWRRWVSGEGGDIYL